MPPYFSEINILSLLLSLFAFGTFTLVDRKFLKQVFLMKNLHKILILAIYLYTVFNGCHVMIFWSLGYIIMLTIWLWKLRIFDNLTKILFRLWNLKRHNLILAVKVSCFWFCCKFYVKLNKMLNSVYCIFLQGIFVKVDLSVG